MTHPLSIEGRSGCDKLSAGYRFIHAIDMRTGVADEFLHDGEAFVTWDDGSYGTINWNWMYDVGRAAAKRRRAAWGLE